VKHAIHRLSLACLALAASAVAGYAIASEPAASGTAPGPVLTSCAPIEGDTFSEIQRTEPLPIPAELSGIAASDMDHIAVSTLAGSTLCVETKWIDSIMGMELSPDSRFFSFAWDGFEEYGYKLVDRSGAGLVVDTGIKPTPSPSGELIAALEYSESGFGSLNALGIWRVTDVPLGEAAIVQMPDGMTDWRMEAWQGDACIAISATTFDNLGPDGSLPEESMRDRYVAREEAGWQIEPAGATGCGAA